jgi:signal transduction histidine kinase
MSWCWWRPPQPHGPPPPWWPTDEAWPPRGAGYAARQRRRAIARWCAAVFWLIFWIAFARGSRTPLPLIAMSVVFWIVYALVQRLAQPIGGIVDAAERVANRDYSVRVPEGGPRPVRSVARAFNTMTSRLQRDDAIRQQLMADIAHELRTPLSVIQGRLEGLIDGVYTPDNAQLEGLLDETRLLARLVEDLRTLAHAEGGTLALHKEVVDVSALLRDIADSLRDHAAAKGVSIEMHARSGLPDVEGDPVRLREVLTNLVTNAMRHTPAGGRVILCAEATDATVTIRVVDSGEGIAAEDLPHVFERFYKGRRSTGSGLGLSIARRLVEAHSGTIRAESTAGSGTTITVTLPVAAPGRHA